MKLLLINPSERYYDLGMDIDPEISRVIDFIRKTREYLAGIEVVLESGGFLDAKLHRTLLGDVREPNGPQAGIRKMLHVPEHLRTGSVFQVPNGTRKPSMDNSLLASLKEGDTRVLVAGFEAMSNVLPSLQDLMRARKGGVFVVANCVGASSPERLKEFLGACSDMGAKVLTTSQLVRMAMSSV